MAIDTALCWPWQRNSLVASWSPSAWPVGWRPLLLAFSLGLTLFSGEAGLPWRQREGHGLYLTASLAILMLGCGRWALDAVVWETLPHKAAAARLRRSSVPRQVAPMCSAIAEANASSVARPFGRLTQMRSMSTVPYPWARRFRQRQQGLPAPRREQDR